MADNILLICGSLNQTMIMHQIAQNLSELNCCFTPYYADGILDNLTRAGALDFTILGGQHHRNTMAYLQKERLPIDMRGQNRNYDLVITCTDLLVQDNIRGKRTLLVQEGMMDPEGILYTLVRYLKLPRFLANTSSTGLSHAYDAFCVASYGYRDLFARKGIHPDKLVVTGIPNFDNAQKYLVNDFPHHNFVLVATSSQRETLKPDNRYKFLQQAREIAAGRKVIFKLHPNENVKRAVREIRKLFPTALILTEGDINPMIANCSVLVAQSSSVIFTGVALGKEVHSAIDSQVLRQLLPVQNGGKSAGQIASICKQLLVIPQSELIHSRNLGRPRWKWRFQDAS